MDQVLECEHKFILLYFCVNNILKVERKEAENKVKKISVQLNYDTGKTEEIPKKMWEAFEVHIKKTFSVNILHDTHKS